MKSRKSNVKRGSGDRRGLSHRLNTVYDMAFRAGRQAGAWLISNGTELRRFFRIEKELEKGCGDEEGCEEDRDGFLGRIHHGKNTGVRFRGDGDENDGDAEPDERESEPFPEYFVPNEKKEWGDNKEGEGEVKQCSRN